MGRTKGDLDKWIVPKRCNVYQTLALLAVLDKDSKLKRWSAGNQTTVATKMRKDYGASNKNKTMQPQSARTTKALAQYMGFITSDDTSIEITEAGKNFLNNHRAELINKGFSLSNPRAPLIKVADEWKEQLIKLQLVNPDQPKCESLQVYPLRFLLEVLASTTYVDKEEIAMFLLTAKRQNDVKSVVNKINSFRSKSYKARKNRVDKFKKTAFGKISLVSAPSARYFMTLCEATGLFKLSRIIPPNPGATKKKKVAAISVDPAKIAEVNSIIARYSGISYFNIRHNKQNVWADYYYNVGVNYPVDICIQNKSKTDVYVEVLDKTTGKAKHQVFEISAKKRMLAYAFLGHDYTAEIYDKTSPRPSCSFDYDATSATITITNKDLSSGVIVDKKVALDEIRWLIRNKGVTSRIQNQLDFYKKLTGKDRKDLSSTRGAFTEYYISVLLDWLKQKHYIDDYQHSWSYDRYMLPCAAGGAADFIIEKDNTSIVFEVTLLRASAKETKNLRTEVDGVMNHAAQQQKLDIKSKKKSLCIFSPVNDNSVMQKLTKRYKSTFKVKNAKTIPLEDVLTVFEKANKADIDKLFS